MQALEQGAEATHNAEPLLRAAAALPVAAVLGAMLAFRPVRRGTPSPGAPAPAGHGMEGTAGRAPAHVRRWSSSVGWHAQARRRGRATAGRPAPDMLRWRSSAPRGPLLRDPLNDPAGPEGPAGSRFFERRG